MTLSGLVRDEDLEPGARASPADALAEVVLVADGYDHSIRWRPGIRLEHLFEDRCDRLRAAGQGDHLAVDAGEETLSYEELDGRANRLARLLLTVGAAPGARIGLLFDAPVHAYVAMLATLKVNAAYVPLDPGFPPERIAYIADDAAVNVVLTLSHLRGRLDGVAAAIVCLDECAEGIAAQEANRLTEAETGPPTDELCYVVYTSGSTGRPKGVAVEHASICNFVRVAVEVYGIEVDDRVYQGMTIAFDFSVEELWVPLIAGATLVPKPPGSTLVGADLAAFLAQRGVTALCCVPTLLATLEDDLPRLRFLLVSGEACPQDLIRRWHRPGRRFLNVYGPTETTVSATWTVVDPDRPVTIGVPLPTYSVVILDPDADRALPRGEVGEIGVAGVGVARGYLNRDDQTRAAFRPDFLGLAGNPSGRIYRTGDLGRINDDGEIEYLGRIDSQVKIRGYRIELTEIESVLLEAPGVAQAVVTTHEPEPGIVELVAYYTVRRGAQVDRGELYGEVRRRLPAYMIPAYLEELDEIPMLPSDKADRNNLPLPKTARYAADRAAHVGPANDRERVLREALGRALRMEEPSVESHFFDDLGADSLLMARFCALIRGHEAFRSVSMRDVYLHPTVRRLAAAVEAGAAPAPAAASEPPEAHTTATTGAYIACGAAQLAFFVAWLSLHVLVLSRGLGWVAGAADFAVAWRRAVVFTTASFATFSILPVVAKWLLAGRFRPDQFPVWSPAYLRFWLVKLLIRGNPMALFAGSPLYSLYLRALGARIGRGVLILSRHVPVCADLLTIGDGTVIHKEASFTCYRARAGRIETGPVTLGAGVVVGEEAVLDISTSMGDGAHLAHSSSLYEGQSVPDGQHFAGTPGQRWGTGHRAVDDRRCGTPRRVAYSAAQLVNALLLFGPLFLTVIVLLAKQVPALTRLISADHSSPGIPLLRDALIVSGALFAFGVVTGLATTFAAAHLLRPLLRPGRVYTLYGLSYWALRATGRATNIRFFTSLFGDSSAIVYYLQALGYRLRPIHQTGSNFGIEVKHDVPSLCAVGTGTMTSDGLSFANAEFSSTSFRVSPVTIGPRNFVGNAMVYPSTGRTGDNCLLGTKLMVPTDGPVREGVGLLGSPPFEIPRSVQRDRVPNAVLSASELRARLRGKNRHNAVTMVLFLLTRWFLLFAAVVAIAPAAGLYRGAGAGGLVAVVAIALPAGVGYWVLVDRLCTRHAAVQPRMCSIYDVAFWRHERFWKVPAMDYLALFNGTPFKNVIWRLLGARVGRRCFDDGMWFTERTLVTVGDDCTFNAGSDLQGHSLEEGAFKSDHIVVGDRCTIGMKGFVHYGVRMGDDVNVEADSFLMKGEDVPAGATWRGNPARAAAPAPAPATPSAGGARRNGERFEPSLASILESLRLSPAPRLDGLAGVAVSVFSRAECRRREADLFAVLSEAEQHEARSLGCPERRNAFVASRALVRMILSAEWRPDVAAGDWRLARSDLGKLEVGGPTPAPIDISVSHNDTVIAVAVSDSHDVGVDVEAFGREGDGEDARWLLSPAERRHLAAAPEADRPSLFLRMWTLKEAYAKCAGAGVTLPFDRLSVSLEPLGVRIDGSDGGERDAWVHQERWAAGSGGHWLAVVAARRNGTAAGASPVEAPPDGPPGLAGGGRV